MKLVNECHDDDGGDAVAAAAQREDAMQAALGCGDCEVCLLWCQVAHILHFSL